MARNFVSHTSATETVDGAKGQNNKMERGGSVVTNPLWDAAQPNSARQRLDSPKYANQTGGYGENSVRETPMNQHGTTGNVEPNVKPQPDLAGHTYIPHTKRPQLTVAVLSPEASFQEFAEYVEVHKGPKTDKELEEVWEWRQKLLGLRVITDKAWRERALAPDEMHLTRNEREQKVIAEAKSQGRNIEKV